MAPVRVLASVPASDAPNMTVFRHVQCRGIQIAGKPMTTRGNPVHSRRRTGWAEQ
jgi:hypothetical protein